MSQKKFQGWAAVASLLGQAAKSSAGWLDDGQRASLAAIREMLPNNGVLIADEVGLGKTRIAVELARAVTGAGGRVAVLVPPGLRFQWQEEFRRGQMSPPREVGDLGSYFRAWETPRKPTEPTPRPWFADSIVIVSHRFANWHLQADGNMWRWALLPALYAHAQKQEDRRWPNGYGAFEKRNPAFIAQAASSIAAHAQKTPVLRRALRDLRSRYVWRRTHNYQDYAASGSNRSLLHRAVGLGLGVFDLVIIDEAHKSRGDESGLSRLLAEVICASDSQRRVALTATPVELDCDQWLNSLERIGVTPGDELRKAIRGYAKAVATVRRVWQGDEGARKAYAGASRTFERALSGYVLRRGKREDPVVQRFARVTGKAADAYRHEQEIRVAAQDLPLEWKRAVCAAEAIGLAVRNASDPLAKRLRLTIGNGHGIATLIDQVTRSDDDRLQEEFDAEAAAHLTPGSPSPPEPDAKRAQRAKWWAGLLASELDSADLLFQHPAIGAAVREIERYTEAGQKVLVFGRFSAPLRAMVSLLNARAIVRCVEAGKTLPQEGLHQGEAGAIGAALVQLQSRLKVADINRYLKRRYREQVERRKSLRDNLVAWLAREFDELAPERRLVEEVSAARAARKEGYQALVRAIHGLVGDDVSGPECADAFRSLVQALRDNGSDAPTGAAEQAEASCRWDLLETRLLEEYQSPEGTFARLLHGNTRYSTRRFLQLAFNRSVSFPRVLVAQSMVGREGLNLHESCRVVVLLHPEWNPGVVEQQIGRVDRMNSRWSREFAAWDAAEDRRTPVPHIEVRPVVFEGTYDEHNWQVLQQRWDDLRAQLHGVVVPARLRADATKEEQELIRALDEQAPDFSPGRGRSRRG